MVLATYSDKHQPDSFEFTKENLKKVDEILARYPETYKRSAVMPLLDLAQRQIAETGPWGENENGGGWIPRVAMDKIAEIIEEPPVKVYEVATFYTMYNLHPVGKHLVQVCGTTPCMLRGAENLVKAAKKKLGIDFDETTEDGLFTLKEVECMGACCNAPMVQINDDYFEDLTPEQLEKLLEQLKQGKRPPKGSQAGRACSAPIDGLTTLKEMQMATATKKPAAKKKTAAKKKPAATTKPANKNKVATAKKPAAKEPAAKKPAAKKPAVKKAVAKKPAAKKPAAKKPAAKKPAAKKAPAKKK